MVLWAKTRLKIRTEKILKFRGWQVVRFLVGQSTSGDKQLNITFSHHMIPLSCGKNRLFSLNSSVVTLEANMRKAKKMNILPPKKSALPKNPSIYGNVCIPYLHLAARFARAHDLHSKAKRLKISCKKLELFQSCHSADCHH